MKAGYFICNVTVHAWVHLVVLCRLKFWHTNTRIFSGYRRHAHTSLATWYIRHSHIIVVCDVQTRPILCVCPYYALCATLTPFRMIKLVGCLFLYSTSVWQCIYLNLTTWNCTFCWYEYKKSDCKNYLDIHVLSKGIYILQSPLSSVLLYRFGMDHFILVVNPVWQCVQENKVYEVY